MSASFVQRAIPVQATHQRDYFLKADCKDIRRLDARSRGEPLAARATSAWRMHEASLQHAREVCRCTSERALA